jgi:peptidoglycan/xylan/chitin deacetylase (PgdA/CDA1 family)
MASDPVINICFHGIGTPDRELEPGEHVYWISEQTFHDILDEVRGWPRVRLSFDDGNVSDVAIGLPALRERDLVADFFPIAGRLDQRGSLAADDVRELFHQGMHIGTHGMWHRTWRGLDAAQAHDEFVAARDILAGVINAPVDTAACPLGQYDRRALAALRWQGYRTVYTSDRLPARPDAWLQARYSVRTPDTAGTLRADALAGPDLVGRVRAAAVGLVKRWR